MLTNQEKKVIEFLAGKEEVYWYEVAAYCKDPSNVKLRTVQKVVSNIKLKYKVAGLDCPITCIFKHLEDGGLNPSDKKEDLGFPIMYVNGQALTKVNRPKPEPVVEVKKQCHIDFELRKYNHQVRSRSGFHNIGEDDFYVLEYLYTKPEQVITLEELRDEVVFPKYGSKLPPKWFAAIQRKINNIRRAVPELRDRILTVKVGSNGTGYMFR